MLWKCAFYHLARVLLPKNIKGLVTCQVHPYRLHCQLYSIKYDGSWRVSDAADNDGWEGNARGSIGTWRHQERQH